VHVEPHLFLVVEGARPLAGGSRHSIELIDEVVLGRGDVRRSRRVVEGGVRRLMLEVPDGRMSSVHARIIRRDRSWTFEDTGSRNGSRVGGELTQKATLEDGDVIEVGRTTFSFRSEVEVTTTTPGDETNDGSGASSTLLPSIEAGAADLLRVVQRSLVPILLLGETGTGKEVLARALHGASGRRGPFVAVNCGALPEALVESQLFGHTKGAFSGAIRDQIGFVREADGGTLFLDEVGDLPLVSQAALLRVLQERVVTPIGSAAAIAVDLRVVSATHVPLEEKAARGGFRSDLFARLSGYVHRLPALRDRREDLGVLTASLLRRIGAPTATLSMEASRAILRHDWPLNIRELEHALSVAAALSTDGVIEGRHLPESVTTPKNRSSGAVFSMGDDALRARLVELFREHEGNVSRVAKAMGKARNQVQRWMKRFGITPADYK
jgi:DNA-binding NtrC family response regulator